MNLTQAVALAAAANAWPRCGQKWPCGAQEEEAERVMCAAGVMANGLTPAQDAAIEREDAQRAAARRAAKEQTADARNQRVAAAVAAATAARDGGCMVTFVREMCGDATISDVQREFGERGAIRLQSEIRSRRVVETRHGMLVIRGK